MLHGMIEFFLLTLANLAQYNEVTFKDLVWFDTLFIYLFLFEHGLGDFGPEAMFVSKSAIDAVEVNSLLLGVKRGDLLHTARIHGHSATERRCWRQLVVLIVHLFATLPLTLLRREKSFWSCLYGVGEKRDARTWSRCWSVIYAYFIQFLFQKVHIYLAWFLVAFSKSGHAWLRLIAVYELNRAFLQLELQLFIWNYV